MKYLNALERGLLIKVLVSDLQVLFIFMLFTEYATCVLTIKGNAFLWHQIRYIVSILLLIGQKKEEPELILNLLDVLHNPRYTKPFRGLLFNRNLAFY